MRAWITVGTLFFFSCRWFVERAERPAGCEPGNEEIDCICLCVCLSGGKRARKEGRNRDYAWLQIKSEPLDEWEGVSLLPLFFVSFEASNEASSSLYFAQWIKMHSFPPSSCSLFTVSPLYISLFLSLCITLVQLQEEAWPWAVSLIRLQSSRRAWTPPEAEDEMSPQVVELKRPLLSVLSLPHWSEEEKGEREREVVAWALQAVLRQMCA